MVSLLCYIKQKKKLKEGDEVIVPAIAWSTTYSPLKYLGFKLKIVDISLEDLNVDINKLLKAITPKTKMIVTVSILGVPANLEKIEKYVNKKKYSFLMITVKVWDLKLIIEKLGILVILLLIVSFFSSYKHYGRWDVCNR